MSWLTVWPTRGANLIGVKNDLSAIYDLACFLQDLTELRKTSRNVKEQRANITPQQAEQRRLRYAQSIGLRPESVDDPNVGRKTMIGGFPVASRNRLPYGQNFDIAHETAHAMMTPDDTNLRGYQRQLSISGRRPDKRVGKISDSGPTREQDERMEELRPGYERAQMDENTASALEYKIDRRAGVDPHKFLQTPVGGGITGNQTKPFREDIKNPREEGTHNYYDYYEQPDKKGP